MNPVVRVFAIAGLSAIVVTMTACSPFTRKAQEPAKKTDLTVSTANPTPSNTSSQNGTDSPTSDTTPVITDYTAPSGGPYPKIDDWKNVSIDVSISKQRVYIKQDDKTLYTMVTSSGLDTDPDNSTPRGTFYVEPERDTWFYTGQYQEGAKYWTSWKDHGIFLFHSVVMDKDGNIKPEEAAKLGHKASHGCFRLTVSDAKWIYDNIPKHTKVVVHD